jgi:hypothetical protein
LRKGETTVLGQGGSALISQVEFLLEPRIELTGIALSTGIKLGLETETGFSRIWKPLEILESNKSLLGKYSLELYKDIIFSC